MKPVGIVLLVLAAAGAGAGGYWGATTYWPQFKAREAERQAAQLLGQAQQVAPDLAWQSKAFADGNVVYHNLAFSYAPGGDQTPVKVTVPTLTVTGDGVMTATAPQLAVTDADGEFIVRFNQARIDRYRTEDNVPLELQGQLDGITLAGSGIEKLKGQLSLLTAVLSGLPAPVQDIPAKLATSAATANIGFALSYQPEGGKLSSRNSYAFPDFISVSTNLEAANVPAEAMQRLNMLVPKDPAQGVDQRFDGMSQGAVLGLAARSGDLQRVNITLTDQGLLGTGVTIYAAFKGIPEAAARVELSNLVQALRPEQLIADPTPEVQQMVTDTKTAAVTLLTSGAKTVQFELTPRDPEKLRDMQRDPNQDWNQLLAAAKVAVTTQP